MSGKKILSTILKIVLPIGAGLYIVWALYQTMTPEQKDTMWQSFYDANYWWVLLSLVFAWVSHLFRAYRWKFLLEPIGYHPKFWNNYHGVMIGYFVNLLITRMGEVSRCVAISRSEGIPFNKAFGTVISERVADFIILMGISLVTVATQWNLLRSHQLFDEIGTWWSNLEGSSIALLLAGAAVLFVGALFVAKRLGFYQKVKTFLVGLLEGMKTILSMEKKWAFIFQTFMIWFLYVAMLWAGFQSLDQVQGVGVGGMFACFIFGSFAIIFVPGGIGVYQAFIAITLMLYGVDKGYGTAFGWIIWASQIVMFIALGAISLILTPISKKDGPIRDNQEQGELAG